MAVFARKASGLTKEASVFDAFVLGFMNNGIGVGLWYLHSVGLYVSPGANLVLGTIIAGLLSLVGIAFSWGILGGSMPRSGGDYVYNSRIIHPAVGTASSWAQGLFISIAWLPMKALNDKMGVSRRVCSIPSRFGFLQQHYDLSQRLIDS